MPAVRLLEQSGKKRWHQKYLHSGICYILSKNTNCNHSLNNLTSFLSTYRSIIYFKLTKRSWSVERLEIKGERFTGHGNRQTIEKPVVEGIPSFSILGMALVYGMVELLLVGWDSG